jgi:hypothetical protein
VLAPERLLFEAPKKGAVATLAPGLPWRRDQSEAIKLPGLVALMRSDYQRRDAYSIGRETFFLRIPQDPGGEGREAKKKASVTRRGPISFLAFANLLLATTSAGSSKTHEAKAEERHRGWLGDH